MAGTKSEGLWFPNSSITVSLKESKKEPVFPKHCESLGNGVALQDWVMSGFGSLHGIAQSWTQLKRLGSSSTSRHPTIRVPSWLHEDSSHCVFMWQKGLGSSVGLFYKSTNVIHEGSTLLRLHLLISPPSGIRIATLEFGGGAHSDHSNRKLANSGLLLSGDQSLRSLNKRRRGKSMRKGENK